MPVPLRLLGATVLAFLLAATLLVLPGPGLPTAQAATTQVSSAHPYGDPVWFPLRTPARIGCAMSGCGTKSDHGYFAIDFLGGQDDPVYAAGAGIAHVGANSGDCSSSSTQESEGRWVWIDHGAGVVTRYHHLNSIDVTDGQLVTPETQIGGMGHSGDVPPCKTSYLHFEVRNGGPTGDRVDFGTLLGCRGGTTVRLPDLFGVSSWNDPRLHPSPRLTSPALTNDCIDASWLQTPAQPKAVAQRDQQQISVSADSAGQAQSWMAFLEVYRPSIKTWRPVEYRTSPGSVGTTAFTQLENRRYRVSVAVRGPSGWSAWSPTTEVRSAPAAPKAPRYLSWKRKTSGSKSYLHYGWYRPDAFGGVVGAFVVARRCGGSAGSLGAWKEDRQGATDTFRNIKKLGSAKACEVRVRAVSDAGTGPWSQTQSIHR